MKTRIPILGLFFMLIMMQFEMSAQVTSVNYQIRYNPDSCWYDAYVIINSGSATSSEDRAQNTALFSISVPITDTIEITRSYAPYENNQTGGNTSSPAQWFMTSSTEDPITGFPGIRFFAITPNLSPAAFYEDLYPGYEIKIFSFTVSSLTDCGEFVRMYENGVDPESYVSGMKDSDFSNGFTLGDNGQIYLGNSTTLFPPDPVIASAQVKCSSGIEIDLTAYTNACQGTLTYEWTGPAGYTSTTEDVLRSPALASYTGNYTVIVTDSIGCTAEVTVAASAKPNAGPDEVICAGTQTIISGTEPTTGTWAAQAGNPAGGSISMIGGGQAQVSYTNAASGTYRYIYSTPSCSDTMQITVNPLPIVGYSGPTSICIGSTTTLNANGAGTWVSNDINVATVNPTTGVVTAVGQGNVTFTFTNSASGCQATTTSLVVNPPPTVLAGPPSNICIGATTPLTPSANGSWTSTPSGIVNVLSGPFRALGLSTGTAKLVFTDLAGCKSDTLDIEVKEKPVVVLTTDSICVNTTAQLQPSTNTTWSSSNSAVASVNNSGFVTGLTAGVVTFTVTDVTTGCSSDESGPFTVVAAPVISNSVAPLCVGNTRQLTPNTGGVWTTNHPSIASVSPTGLITGVGQGLATFTFTQAGTNCTSTTGNITVNPLPTVLSNPDTVCVTGTSVLTPNSGGTWAITAGITNVSLVGNIVTGTNVGNATLRFTQSSTGCFNSLPIAVRPRPTVSITGDSEICINASTQLSPTTGGSWRSSDPTIATVSNTGLVTGVGVGNVVFYFTDATTLCESDATSPVTVRNIPQVAITGDNQICVGFTTTLSVTPVTGGTWYAVNPTIATIDAITGVVTAVAPGFARFYFIDNFGCQSINSAPVTVSTPPVVSYSGPQNICVGQNTTVTPSTGGVWWSSNTSIAEINNSGLISGIGAGTVKFVYTSNTTFCNSDTLTTVVSASPILTLAGDSIICIGETSTVTSTLPGTWVINPTSIATISTTGIVTGVAQGTAIVSLNSSTGCPSANTIPIVVNGKPAVNVTGGNAICPETTTTLSPTTGGTWLSLNPSVATVTNSGVVTGVAAGLVQFVFTSDEGCPSDPTAAVQVNPKPVTSLGGSNPICVGQTTIFNPQFGGSWTSGNTSIASINNAGLATGLAPGDVRFVFTNASTGCKSDSTISLTVTQGPNTILADDSLCIGESTIITPDPLSTGTWAATPSGIVNIDNTGAILALNAGVVTFVFTDNNGCKSPASATLTVNERPTVIIQGSPDICIGGTTQLSPSTGGTWASSNTAIATVSNSGLVTGISNGAAVFTFTNSTTGCPSFPTDSVKVNAAPVIGYTGPQEVCVSGTTQLFPTEGGTWISNNPAVAYVNNEGLVTAVGPGRVTFTFTQGGTGCASASSTDTLVIEQCLNPDFNATFVNIPVDGDVSTNDGGAATSVYGPTPVLLSSPVNSTESISMNSDGTYTFTADKEGVYIYNVPVCSPPQEIGCPVSELTITVRDNISPDNLPVANVDFGTTLKNIAVTLATLSNDRCVNIITCSLDPASVIVISAPSNGVAVPNATTGDITYTPNSGWAGLDTLVYRVCVVGEPANCATAKQIITVSDPNASNITNAADDFAVTPQETPVSGNVSDNDLDPEGDNQTVIAQTVTVPNVGTLVLNSDGTYTFTPVTYFYGPVEFVYTTFDDHPTNPDTVNATLHILVMQDLTVKVRVYLEGAIQRGTQNSPEDGRPLMRDNLRVSTFTGTRFIPNTDPYSVAPNTGHPASFLAKFNKVGPGLRTDLRVVDDSIFANKNHNSVVDWVFVELRSKTNNQTIIATRSGLVQRDGDVQEVNGSFGLRFPGVPMDDYYVVVKHRTHLGAMSKFPQTPTQLTTLVNFTTDEMPTFDFGTSHPTIGALMDYTDLAQKKGTASFWRNYYALWAGDMDFNGKIKYDSPNDDLNRLSSHVKFYNKSVYNAASSTAVSNTAFTSNFDFAYGYLLSDHDMNSKSKFDNPSDDKNLLYSQLLFYKLNTSLISNFDFFIQQVP